MTWRLQISGVVQGVGFRPMVYAVAGKLRINGVVSNNAAGVEVIFNAPDAAIAADFLNQILKNIPPGSVVSSSHLEAVEPQYFPDFEISASAISLANTVLITPDAAICNTCRHEIHMPSKRRYQYAFTSCSHCGPRFSITQKLPFDRPNTTMQHFQRCAACESAYSDPSNRRFHAQTISCGQCGISMSLHFQDQQVVENKHVIKTTFELILNGKIVAVKGIGGYLLLCDATNPDVIKTLRQRKQRPSKPFAVLYPDEEILKKDLILTPGMADALGSPVAPIVIVPVRQNASSGIQTSLIAPGLNQLGVMLPSTPLLELIAAGVGKPIIATSANFSQSPIIYKDGQALETLFEIADAILQHDLEIVIPQDDSVIRFTDQHRKIMLRRSRGLAPSFLSPARFADGQILAMGAQLKSTFAILYHSNILISPYIGDLESLATFQNYEFLIHHLLQLTGALPELILSDLHPDYTSTQFGQQLAARFNIPVINIQHHEAHFAAVLVENNLEKMDAPVLGVIWDGTGLGTDGQIWGGEFFDWNGNNMERIAQLAYFPALAGEKMAREPRLSALAAAPAQYRPLLSPIFTDREWQIYTNLIRSNTLKTSSMGRLFDAVAAWCGLCTKTSYEGEAALLLEAAATAFFQNKKEYFLPYPVAFENNQLNTTALINFVIEDRLNEINPAEIAARFHCTLVEMIRLVARAKDYKHLAFSGGVFQNALLVGLVEQYLSPEFKLFFHQELSPNDENISFGQLAHWQLLERFNNILK